ncbi:MAG: hypothetical protein E7290_07410 [Lachnospiraceae bacterium]|nr:hypothetical protein [Lachnospiraceae bacterium]
MSPDWIEEFISIISDAKNTNKSSVQDFPLADNYGTIHIFSKDNSLTIYYYEENGRYFLKQPYHGIYEIEHANAISSCSRFA